jgi:hypothetical protein
MSASDRIEIASLYGANTRQGPVELRWGELKAQLTVSEAIDHARRILEAANAAASDAQIARFLTERLGQPLDMVSAVLGEFREWRQENEPR